MKDEVRLGLLGAGFVCDFYMQALRNVPHQRVTCVFSRTEENARRFAEKWDVPAFETDLDRMAERDDIDLFVCGLPNFLHRDAIVLLAAKGRNVACTKPLGRNAAEGGQMFDAVRRAGVFHGYLETEVFTPAVVQARRVIEDGGIGRVLVCKSREAHMGSHSPFNLDRDLAGGGPMLTMGCHCVAVIRYLMGKERRVRDVFAWTDTLLHKEWNIEDNALLMMRYEDGGMGIVENSWSAHGGMDLRNEVYGSAGALFTDVTRATPLRAFSLGGAGYVMEKAESDKGWVQPVPDEPYAYGYVGQLQHCVEALRRGEPARENFDDGFIVNRIIDAGYRAAREGRWVEVEAS